MHWYRTYSYLLTEDIPSLRSLLTCSRQKKMVGSWYLSTISLLNLYGCTAKKMYTTKNFNELLNKTDKIGKTMLVMTTVAVNCVAFLAEKEREGMLILSKYYAIESLCADCQCQFWRLPKLQPETAKMVNLHPYFYNTFRPRPNGRHLFSRRYFQKHFPEWKSENFY